MTLGRVNVLLNLTAPNTSHPLQEHHSARFIDTGDSPLMIRPLPTVAPHKTSRKRRTQKAEILTSTHFKNEQREKNYKKKNKKKSCHEVITIVKKNLKSKLSEERNLTSKRSVIRTNLYKASYSNIRQLPKVFKC